MTMDGTDLTELGGEAPVKAVIATGKGPHGEVITLESPDEVARYLEQMAEITSLRELLGLTAIGDSTHYYNTHPSRLGPRTEWKDNHFVEYLEDDWKEYSEAYSHLLGKTPISAWAWDESPLSTIYSVAKAFYQGATRGREGESVDDFINGIRKRRHEFYDNLDKRYPIRAEAGPKPITEEDLRRILKDMETGGKLPYKAQPEPKGIDTEEGCDGTVNALFSVLMKENAYMLGKEYLDAFIEIVKEDKIGAEKYEPLVKALNEQYGASVQAMFAAKKYIFDHDKGSAS